MRKFLMTLGLAIGLMLAGGSRVSAQVSARVYVGIQPPVEIVEKVPPAPGPAYVWIKGHHMWRDGHFVWVGGRWATPPRGMRLWVPGHWDRDPGGWFWVEGRWARE
jgi:hypothetical protein